MTCPTPKKSRFATAEGAESAARHALPAIGVHLYPYPCTEECGWWHLTSKARRAQQPVPEPTAQQIEAVRSLDDAAFRELVSNDARSGAAPLRSRILREPTLSHRWISTIKEIQRDMAVQFAQRAGRTDDTTREWRKRATAFQAALSQRRLEAGRIACGVARNAPGRNASERDGREAAGEAAIDRLIAAHRREFTQLLAEEYERLGIELPARIQRYQALHAAEEAS